MRQATISLLVFCTILLIAPLASQAEVVIDTVPVGNPGNAGELTGTVSGPSGIVGGVSYNYRIATYEVTNSQYVEFLNAKAKSDPLGLYNTSMGTSLQGGITRSGVAGSFSYAVKNNMGNKPVNYVSWYDSIRFINWLNNGQGDSDTETGAYILEGSSATPSNFATISRKPGGTWFLPSEDEWYKAAYYQPAAQGGDSDNYWLYPTRSNSAPTIATASSVGDISNPGINVANYSLGAVWNGSAGNCNLTTVGSAGPLSASYYGTFDQGGNVWEWNEKDFNVLPFAFFRGSLGGAWDGGASFLAASWREATTPANEGAIIGFRVAMIPEPSTFALAAAGLAAGGLCLLRRRCGR